MALHPMTPWAEQLRNLDMKTPDEARNTRVPIWALRVRLEVEPLLIGFAEAADPHYLHAEDLVADDQNACRSLAGNLVESGVSSIIVPSAALPATFNLVIFQPMSGDIGYQEEPIDPEDVPASLIAQDGRCPEGLWNLVHYKDSPTPHAALDAHLNGDEFEFREPDVTEASCSRSDGRRSRPARASSAPRRGSTPCKVPRTSGGTGRRQTP
jgi:hypothetical protein